MSLAISSMVKDSPFFLYCVMAFSMIVISDVMETQISFTVSIIGLCNRLHKQVDTHFVQKGIKKPACAGYLRYVTVSSNGFLA